MHNMELMVIIPTETSMMPPEMDVLMVPYIGIVMDQV